MARNPWRPYAFQGGGRRAGYFEGWYFKLIDAPRETVLAVIPGIALGRSPADGHAFVQVIDARRGATQYHRFPLSAFRADEKRFDVRVGRNRFSADGMELDLGGGEGVRGELVFRDAAEYPRSALSPGIMGPYSFLPMECYHDVVHVSHRPAGTLALGGRAVAFDGGEGYIEKDWGRSFPSAWIWLQANHFGGGASLMLSIARIPWLRGKFTGLIAYLCAGGRLYRFASYNGGRILALAVEGGRLRAALGRGGLALAVEATQGPAGTLRAPKNGLMDRTVEESIAARVAVRLTDGGGVLFEGESENCGMELSDHLEEILREF